MANESGVPPATLAEWTLGTTQGLDYYDVSVVDGFNIPMAVTSPSCSTASCPVDLNPNCEPMNACLFIQLTTHIASLGPAEIAGPTDSTGANAGCKSACEANLDGNQADSANCCSGSHVCTTRFTPNGITYLHITQSEHRCNLPTFRCPGLQLLQEQLPRRICVRLRRVQRVSS